MTKRRPIIAAAFALSTLAGGVVAGSVGAQRVPSMPLRSTTTKVPTTTPKCYGGSNCTPRTKNAALPTTTAPKTTTTKPRTVTTPMPTLNTLRTKNAALPATTTTRPRTVTTPVPTVNTLMRTKNAALPTTTTTVAPKGKATITMPASGG